MVKAICTVEVDGPLNENFHFRPLGRRIRGRFDPRRMDDPQDLVRRYPKPIPGQRLGLTADGGAFLVDPLHDEEHADIAAKIVSEGYSLPPKRETFDAVDQNTWSYWLRGAVDCGLAKIVQGSIPEVEGEPCTSFITAWSQDPTVRLAEALEKQTELLAKILAR